MVCDVSITFVDELIDFDVEKSGKNRRRRAYSPAIPEDTAVYDICRLQTADCRPQTADCRLQTAVCGLRSAVCSLQSAVCSLQSAVCSLLMSYTGMKSLWSSKICLQGSKLLGKRDWGETRKRIFLSRPSSPSFLAARACRLGDFEQNKRFLAS